MVQKIGKLDVTMNGILKTIANLVSKWKPGEWKKETQYSSALADYLREVCQPDTRIETEYRDGGTTADVWLCNRATASF